MRRTRRNHAAVFKANVALAALKGNKTLAELAQDFDLHANQIVEWKQQMQERAAEVFGAFCGPALPTNSPPLVPQEWNRLFRHSSSHGWSPKMVTVRARHRRGGDATAEHNRRPKPLIGVGLLYLSKACCSV